MVRKIVRSRYERPIIVEQYGDGIEAYTQVQATRVVYQVRVNGAVKWQRVVAFPDHKMAERRGAAQEQERQAQLLKSR